MKKKFLSTILILFLLILIFITIYISINIISDTKSISDFSKLSLAYKAEKTKQITTVETTARNELDELSVRQEEIKDKINRFGKNVKGVPVLMYHFFYDKNLGETGKDNNFFEISKFEKQLKYVIEQDFFFPTFEELKQYIDGTLDLPSKSVIFTVDDGNPTFFRLAIPVIERYHVPVTSFLITSTCDKEVIADYGSPSVHFESHSHNMHQAGKNGKGLFVSLEEASAYQDIQRSIQFLGSKKAFCYPFGHTNQTAKSVLKKSGYLVAFTTNYGRVKPGMDALLLPRIRVLRDDSLETWIQKIS